MASKKCPQCGLWYEEIAMRCDCGYQFPPIETNATDQSPVNANQPSQKPVTSPPAAKVNKSRPENQIASDWYIWLWVSPLLTIPTLGILLGFALASENNVGNVQILLPLAVLGSALWHLILLYPALKGRTEFTCWHGRQALILAGVRTLVALLAVTPAGAGNYAFTAFGVPILILLWLVGNLWGQGQARRGDCALMRWTGHGAGLPIPIGQASPSAQLVVQPQPDSALVDHLVSIIRFNPDPAVRHAALDELEHLGLVESL